VADDRAGLASANLEAFTDRFVEAMAGVHRLLDLHR